MRSLALAVAALVTSLLTTSASAQSIPAAYHGHLLLRPAAGSIDSTGTALINVVRWTMLVTGDSNGIAPDHETISVNVGGENPGAEEFPIPADGIRTSRNGKTWSYKAPRNTQRGVRTFRLSLRPDGSYRVSFSVAGANLSTLTTQTPVCFPLGVFIGDDDFFSNISARDPSFGPRFRIRTPAESEDCGVGWPGC